MRKTISLFLACIITSGTLTAFYQSLQSGIGADYIKEINKYKINCNNINLNLSCLDINAIPQSLTNLVQD
jgi:hypothetical protein